MTELKKTGIEEKLAKNGWKEAVLGITMPEQMKKKLINRKTTKKRIPYKLRYARAISAVCMLLVLLTTGMTVHAVYIHTHLRVFFEQDITPEQFKEIEEELRRLEGVSSYRYVSSDDAWKEFGEVYLTPELVLSFGGNPLAESANFEVGILLNADVREIKAYIEELDGVRLVSGLWEG